jgi:hypothetical protein
VQLDSAFQLQEHLAALHYTHTASNTIPMTRETASLLAAPPPGTDRTLWLYELCRLLIGQCNSLIVGFLFDSPPCSAATCPEMRASEWQFLCAVHESPKSCCAIDYCCHTLDWAANVVTNPKIFPSRFVAPDGLGGQGGAGAGAGAVGGGGGGHGSGDRGAALKNLVNVFRRLHRIFAHAWFQHRGVFWAVETHTGLYVFFKTVCDLYDLLPAENYKLPPDAEGLEQPTVAGANSNLVESASERNAHQQAQQPRAQNAPVSILRPGQQQQQQQQQQRSQASNGFGDQEESFQPVGRTATRRHVRSSPSTGSAVTTVMEADEEESAAVARKLKQMHISEEEEPEEEAKPRDRDEQAAAAAAAAMTTTTTPAATAAEQDRAEPQVEEVPVIVLHGSRPIANVTPQAMKPEEALPLQPHPEPQPEPEPEKEEEKEKEKERLSDEGRAAPDDKVASPMEPMTAIPDADDDDPNAVPGKETDGLYPERLPAEPSLASAEAVGNDKDSGVGSAPEVSETGETPATSGEEGDSEVKVVDQS